MGIHNRFRYRLVGDGRIALRLKRIAQIRWLAEIALQARVGAIDPVHHIRRAAVDYRWCDKDY